MWTRQCMGNEMNARQCMGCIAAACCRCLLLLPAGLPAAAACWAACCRCLLGCLLAGAACLADCCVWRPSCGSDRTRQGGRGPKGATCQGEPPPIGQRYTNLSIGHCGHYQNPTPYCPIPLPDSDNPPQNAPPLLGPPGRKTVLGSYRA